MSFARSECFRFSRAQTRDNQLAEYWVSAVHTSKHMGWPLSQIISVRQATSVKVEIIEIDNLYDPSITTP